MEQFVIQFPAAAAWLIVGLLSLIATLVTAIGRHLFTRMGKQDQDLQAIKSMVGEKYHQLEKRVIRLETHNGWIPQGDQ